MTDGPSGHTYLDFNSPLSDARAAALVAGLRPLPHGQVLDLCCGWAELLLRLLAAEPTASGLGLDVDAGAIARGQANAAARGLAGRVRLEVGDATRWAGPPADAVLCVGASHAWGGTAAALRALLPRVRPGGGRLLFGEAFWERPPTEAALSGLGATPEDFGSLAELVDLAMATGFRVLAVSQASLDEWDDFESRWCAGRERWLLDHPDAPDADQVRAVLDEHRRGWLHGYRSYLGLAYLTLVRP